MNDSTRRSLWTAFGALLLFVFIAATLNIIVLQSEKRQHTRAFQVYEHLMKAMMQMDGAISSMLAASRGYSLTQQTQFLAQYDESIRSFEKTAEAALQLATEPADRTLVNGIRGHFNQLKELCDKQISYTEDGEMRLALETMLEAARQRRSAYDFSGAFIEREGVNRSREVERLDALRLALTLLLVLMSVAIIFTAVMMMFRIERSLESSIARQVKKTEAMIAGMAEGVMLVDGEGKVVFINPAGAALLGTQTVGVPMEKHAETYRLKSTRGRYLDVREVPAAQALSTGKAAKDVTVVIDRGGDKQIAVSMSAVPLQEDEKVTGVIVSFRDITERRRLEEEMQLQAERAQILADAGAFFASNIDPVWVTQAIVERVAEVLGDWAAIVLKNPDSNEMRVSAIYHRDMASLGLAWSFMYRQPLTIGEGLIGQVISSGYPSLTSNLESSQKETRGETYHAVQMKLHSLLVLPLRTRREIIGALIIAANDPERQMNDQKLPLAEDLAERAALAIENARLYTEQVEARRKVEDLSRLKDEFLSIASHELRTPVTSIKGYTQLAKALIQEGDLSTSAEYLSVALDQIDRMSRLILELLDVSRIETGRLEIRRETIDWRPFVEKVVARHHTALNERQFKLDLPPNSSEVAGDRDRLEQVLGNLLENAVKYSPEGTEILVKVRDENDRVVTAISDRGIGIPSDEIGQVFERFHRGRQVSSTNYGGLGLGLYISKQIVERHGGSIWVESREGQGTTFYFSLPTQNVASRELTAAS